MIVTRAPRNTPPCEAKVPKPASAEQSQTWRQRVARANRAGRDPTLCANVSGYLVNGVPMCPSHAGQEALRWLLAHPPPPRRKIEVIR